jgi:hypothetical protein
LGAIFGTAKAVPFQRHGYLTRLLPSLRWRLGAFDEALREFEAGAELEFAAGHFSVVGFVVVSGEVEEAVEDEDFQFAGEGVALIGSLAAGGIDADGDVSRDFFGCIQSLVFGREGEDVSGFVDAAELAVEFLDGLICGEEDVDLAAEMDGGLGFGKEADEGWLGWDALRPWDRGWTRAGGKRRNHEFARGGVGIQIWVEEDHLARGRGARRR